VLEGGVAAGGGVNAGVITVVASRFVPDLLRKNCISICGDNVCDSFDSGRTNPLGAGITTGDVLVGGAATTTGAFETMGADRIGGATGGITGETTGSTTATSVVFVELAVGLESSIAKGGNG
jgi:hypothetical protein